jgi:hypothetical protein
MSLKNIKLDKAPSASGAAWKFAITALLAKFAVGTRVRCLLRDCYHRGVSQTTMHAPGVRPMQRDTLL